MWLKFCVVSVTCYSLVLYMKLNYGNLLLQRECCFILWSTLINRQQIHLLGGGELMGINGHTHWASNSKIAGSNPSVVIWCSVLCTCIDKALLYEIYIVSIHSVETGCQVMLRVNLWETGVPSRGSRWSALVSYGDEHRPSWLREGFNIYVVKPKIPLLLLLILFVGLTEMLYWSGLYSTWC